LACGEERPAAGGQDAGCAAQKAADHFGFAGAEEGFAVTLEDLGDGAVGGADDFLVGIAELHPQLPREGGADGGLARPHHPHKDDCLRQSGHGSPFRDLRARTCRREIVPLNGVKFPRMLYTFAREPAATRTPGHAQQESRSDQADRDKTEEGHSDGSDHQGFGGAGDFRLRRLDGLMPIWAI
jgi:hypothetical protein